MLRLMRTDRCLLQAAVGVYQVQVEGVSVVEVPHFFLYEFVKRGEVGGVEQKEDGGRCGPDARWCFDFQWRAMRFAIPAALRVFAQLVLGDQFTNCGVQPLLLTQRAPQHHRCRGRHSFLLAGFQEFPVHTFSL